MISIQSIVLYHGSFYLSRMIITRLLGAAPGGGEGGRDLAIRCCGLDVGSREGPLLFMDDV